MANNNNYPLTAWCGAEACSINGVQFLKILRVSFGNRRLDFDDPDFDPFYFPESYMKFDVKEGGFLLVNPDGTLGYSDVAPVIVR